MNRKELKQQGKEKYLNYKKKKKAFKDSLASMSREEKKQAKKEFKLNRKREKKAFKESLKTMDKEEKKVAKKRYKYFKKYKRRKIKYSVLGFFAILLIILGIKVKPIISDVSELFAVDINTDSHEAIQMREEGEKLAKEITDEGIILIKNNENLLPLKDKKLNVFGAGAYDMRLAGGGSGAADVSRAINIFDAFTQSGIVYNDELFNMYSELGFSTEIESQSGLLGVITGLIFGGNEDEPEISYLTNEVINNAKDFSSNALIVLTSDSVEATDANDEQLTVKGNKLKLIEKVSNNFENVIIVVNAGNTLELGFIEEHPSIKSVLYIGTPGATGPLSLAEIIAGKVNPSGHLSDTLVYDNSTAPGTENFGDFEYENFKMSKLEYEEGIYIGYRYYETRYKDNDEKYDENVLYPFGHGLSYTDFKWSLENHSVDDENVTLDVVVENIGDVPGKDVVQVYYEPPYYEGGIEKSAISLVEFEKTKLLKPGESQMINISFKLRDMASWDMIVEEAYVLDPGTYKINVSENVHKTVDSFSFDLDNKITYHKSLTGYAYKNQFEYASGDLTYLSRNNWEGTYPTSEDINLKASKKLIESYNKTPMKVEGEMTTLNANNNIQLKDLKGLSYDDPKWDLFMNQFKKEELIKFFTRGGWKTVGIDRLGIPSTKIFDGPAGLNYFFGNMTAAAYPSELTLASTWNDKLIYKMGVSMGKEANAYDVQGIYAPAMNIHRTAYGGRNFEYFSEDPILSGKMGTAIIEGIQSQDVLVTMKHFILNEQEVNARSGLFLFANEQSIRELYLKPFEYAETNTDVTGVMSSFIHVGHKWSGGNEELLQNVLRGEWGFKGFVTTDAFFGFMDPYKALKNGNDLLLTNITATQTENELLEIYESDPVGVSKSLKDRVHTVLYNILNKTKAVK